MKKTLAVAAVLAAFAGSAAADVTVYGLVDLGMLYTHSDDGADSVQMKSGIDSANRIGFLASEKIGDVTVGVKLENSFSSDTGKDPTDSFFNRETRLYVKGAYGEVGFGRFGALDSTTGGHNIAGSRIHALTGVGNCGDTSGIFLGQNSRLANAIAYKSPKFNGFQAHAMYATAEGDENSHEGDRYYALGATYDAGAFSATFAMSLEDLGDTAPVAGKAGAQIGNVELPKLPLVGQIKVPVTGMPTEAVPHAKGEETKAYTAGVSYDFGVTKALVAAQYFDNVVHADYGTVDGYGVTVGAVTPVMGGTLKTQFGYMEAEQVANAAQEYKAYDLAAAYYYSFSKRTQVYGVMGYNVKEDKLAKTEKQTFNAGVGMIHNF